jgi:hypothetical protein
VFRGRVPKSVLARHYVDFSPEKLEKIYDDCHLVVSDTVGYNKKL